MKSQTANHLKDYDVCFEIKIFFVCCRDTFAKLDGWHKGVLFINGFNVGRYWPTEGPQQTLYVPATILMGKCRPNSVVVLEQDKSPCLQRKSKRASCTIEFVVDPVINGTVPVQLGKIMRSKTQKLESSLKGKSDL